MKEWFVYKGEKYKTTRPKAKKKRTLNIKTISPKTNWSLPTGFGFGTNQAKLLFELSFPSINANLTMIKDDFVSRSPNYPVGCDKYFSKNWVTNSTSRCNNHVKWREVEILVNWNGFPTILAEGALKE